MTTQTKSQVCRLCPAFCGIRVEVEDSRVAKVSGDSESPYSRGYSCVKGRSLPEQHRHPDRLLQPMRRRPDGGHEAVALTRALDDIADRLHDIVDQHGPRAVALYAGTFQMSIPLGMHLAYEFMERLGSPMSFNSGMIDQPGRPIAASLHGTWDAGMYPFDEADAWLLIGVNPVVSLWGPMHDPVRTLTSAKRRGARLIVVDPRRTETAEHADLHLQIRPGEDATLLAGIIRVVLDERLHDDAFVTAEVDGIDALRAAVQPFTTQYVAARCGVPAEQIVAAARMFARARRGGVTAGTGPNMAGDGTLTEYLVLALQTICGGWVREGEPVYQPFALLPERRPKAQANPPWQGFGFGERLRSRDLACTAGGMPTSALADEILLPGDGRVRALIVLGGNPVAAWPDQLKTIDAMRSLELLVSLDPRRTQTSSLADYIIPPPHLLEVEGTTQVLELFWYMGSGLYFQRPYAQHYAPAVERPDGSELLEEWEFFYEIARRLHLQLNLPRPAGMMGAGARHAGPMDMAHKPTSHELVRAFTTGSRIAIDDVMQHEHGHLFDDPALVVAGKDPTCTTRLQVADPHMMRDLAALPERPAGDEADFPFRLISRRMRNFMNSTGHGIERLARDGSHNPAFMHPEDLEALGLESDDEVLIQSARAAIPAIVRSAADVRRGSISMAHAFGGTPEEDARFREIGSPTGRLVDNTASVDPYSGIPRMSAIPVRVRPAG